MGPDRRRLSLSGTTLKHAAGSVPGAAGTIAGLVVLSHAASDVYGVPAWGVVVTVGLLAMTLVGSVLVWRAGAGGRAGAAVVGIGLVVLGCLSILSVGFVLLVAGVAVLAWAGLRHQPGRVLLGAALVGTALPVLVVLALDGPLVQCSANGASSGENLFMAFSGSGSQQGTVTAGRGSASGRESGAGYEYAFACSGDRLVSFRLRWH